jgi:Cytochrome P460
MKLQLILILSLACLNVLGQQQTQPDEPQYTTDGQLKLPVNYREWIYLSSGLGMTYGFVESAANAVVGDRFDNVFVTPRAYRAFLATGTWPDKTMFVMEVRTASSKGSINKGGHFQQELVGLEAHVKDQSRFPTKWEFFGFSPTARTGKPQGAKSSCQTCHSANGAVDDTFVQFYPTLLPVAKAKGTLRPEIGK